MAGLQPSDVYGNPFLTSYALGFPATRGLIGREVAPPMKVDAEAGTFHVVDFDYGRRTHSVVRGPDSKTPHSAPPLSTGTYVTKEYTHGAFLSDRVKNAAMDSPTGFKGIDKHYSEHPTMVVMLAHETDVVTALTTTGNYYSSALYTTLTGNDQWSALATSNPQSDVIAYGEAIEGLSGLLLEELSLILGRQVYHKLRQHPGVKSNVQYVQKTNPEDIGPAQLAAYFGVKQVLVGGALRVTSNVGAAAETVVRAWGKNAILCNIDPAPNGKLGTAGSLVTAVVGSTDMPRIRNFRTNDPEGTDYIAEFYGGVTRGVKTGEGLRTAALIAGAIA